MIACTVWPCSSGWSRPSTWPNSWSATRWKSCTPDVSEPRVGIPRVGAVEQHVGFAAAAAARPVRGDREDARAPRHPVDVVREGDVVEAVAVAPRRGRIAHDAELHARDVLVPLGKRAFGRRAPARRAVGQLAGPAELQLHRDGRAVGPWIAQQREARRRSGHRDRGEARAQQPADPHARRERQRRSAAHAALNRRDEVVERERARGRRDGRRPRVADVRRARQRTPVERPDLVHAGPRIADDAEASVHEADDRADGPPGFVDEQHVAIADVEFGQVRDAQGVVADRAAEEFERALGVDGALQRLVDREGHVGHDRPSFARRHPGRSHRRHAGDDDAFGPRDQLFEGRRDDRGRRRRGRREQQSHRSRQDGGTYAHRCTYRPDDGRRAARPARRVSGPAEACRPAGDG